jgi:hypothetical protein
MSDAILVLAGGASQRPFVQAWRGLGLPLVLADRDPRPPCRDLCDAFICASVHDADAVLSGIEQLGGDFAIRAVWTQSSGPATLTQARVSRSLGLPAFTPELAELALDKRRFGDFLRARGLAAPALVPPGADAAQLAYPLVVRPVATRVGKEAIARVDAPGELAPALARAAQASATGEAFATAFVPGEDWIYIGARIGEALQRIAVVREHNAFVAGGLANLGAELVCRPPGAAVARIEAEIERLVAATGGGSGVLLASFRVADEQPCWTELHLDFGGDWLWEKLLLHAFGEDAIAGVSADLLAGAAHWQPPAPRPSLLYTLVEADRAALEPAQRLARELGLELLLEAPRAGRAPHQRIGAVAIALRTGAECRAAAQQLDKVLCRGQAPRRAQRAKGERSQTCIPPLGPRLEVGA